MAVPTDYSNLELWYKADAITGVSNGADLTSWVDSSGNGRDTSAVTDNPVYYTNVINSLPAVDFGYLQGMSSGYTVSNPFTVFVFYNVTQAGGAARRTIQGSNNWLIGAYNVNHVYYNSAFITGPSHVQNQWFYATATQVNPGGAVFRVDGSEIGTNANTTAPGTLGMGVGGAYAESAMGYITEVILYSRVLNAGEISGVEGYLYSKYFETPPVVVPRSWGAIV